MQQNPARENTAAYTERHRRIHEAHQDGQQPPGANEEEFENEGNELDDADENSSVSQCVPCTMVSASSVTSIPSMNMPSAMSMMAPQMIAPQLLQQRI